MVLAEVENRVLGLVLAWHAHERPPADLARDEATARRFGVRAADRADGDAEGPGEVTVSRQARAVRQAAPGDIVGQRIDDHTVQRPGAALEVGRPDCHGINIVIDT